jgi:hypothetical protein
MLYEPVRHEALQSIDWNEGRVRDAMAWVVRDTEQAFSPDRYWPIHPRDLEEGDDPALPSTTLYYGACGVIWALHYLQAVGAARLSRSYLDDIETLLARNRAVLKAFGRDDVASYLMGDTPILMLHQGADATPSRAHALAALIEGNLDHPSRELMWGAPGTLLAALFLHARSGEARWAALYRDTAARLWSQLEWSPEFACAHWPQSLYGQRSTYLGAAHGFVGAASSLMRGRHLLDAQAWAAWQACIVNTVQRTASWEGGQANWRGWLDMPPGKPVRMFMQFCHGAPGFVIGLADMPGTALDALLVAAGEAIWSAGPLTKGSNLCHGSGGNGYAFLKLYRRTGDVLWLQRARAFAMHGIAQMEADARQHGRLRYSLWTGDPGFAIYLWHCLQSTADFPTLDVYYGQR